MKTIFLRRACIVLALPPAVLIAAMRGAWKNIKNLRNTWSYIQSEVGPEIRYAKKQWEGQP